MLHDILYRLRSLFCRKKVEQEMAEELEFHIQHEIERQIQKGSDPEDAKRRARLIFGGADQIKEECRQSRGVGLIESIMQDVRHSIRSLAKTPSFAAGAIVTLALGIATTIVVFSVVDSALLNPVPFKDAGRLVRIYQWSRTGGGPFQSVRLFAEWREQHQIFDQVEAHSERNLTLNTNSDPEVISASSVTVDLFQLLGVRPQIGRDFSRDESSAPVALIGQDLWMRRFGGSPGVLGKEVRLNDSAVTIIGVMPAWFRFPASSVEVWVPFEPLKQNSAFLRSVVSPIAKIRSGLSIQSADAQVAALAPQLDPTFRSSPNGLTSRLQSLDRYAANGLIGKTKFVQDRRTAILVMFGAGMLVLLVSCANSANLFLSRSVSRTREVAVRAALGASHLRLIRYLLTETIIVGLTAGILGTAGAWLTIHGLLRVIPPNLIQDSLNPIRINGRAAICAIVASIVTGVVVGAVPAIQVLRRDVIGGIKAGGASKPGRDRTFRGAIVAIEGALAVVLLIGAGLMSRTLIALTSVEPGWSAAGTLIVEPRFTADRYRRTGSMMELEKQAAEHIRLLPGVQDVALAEAVPLLNPSISFGTIESETSKVADALVSVNQVTGGYFQALGIPLLAGRSFQSDPASPTDDDLHNVIVTREIAARLWPKQNALGQRMRFHFGSQDPPDWFTVIGVVGDVQTFAFDSPSEPLELYRMLPASNRARWITVKTRSMSATREIREIIGQLDAELGVDIRAMDEIYRSTLAAPKFQTILFTGFAILTLLLAAAGVYAVVAYEASRQTREIGIRMAVGAKGSTIIGYMLSSFLLLSSLGVVAGISLSLFLTRWMTAMLYAVHPNDPATFLAAVIVLLFATLLGAFLPAYRASRINPAVALRWD
jgi:putative ABC transport system permease protein